MNCPRCNDPLIHRNRTVLLFTGSLFVLTLAVGIANRWLLVPAGFLSIVGIYLIAWGTVGKGLWCRHCKQVPFV